MNDLNNQNVSNKTNENVNMQYALCGDRILAALRDYFGILGLAFLISFLFSIINLIFHLIITSKGLDVSEISYGNLFTVIITIFSIIVPMLIIIFGYPVKVLIGLLSSKKASFGQYKRNLKVVNADGSELTSSQAIVRVILMCVLSSFNLVSFIMMLCTEKRQTFYDMILNQVVVKDGEQMSSKTNNIIVICTILLPFIISFILVILSLIINHGASMALLF